MPEIVIGVVAVLLLMLVFALFIATSGRCERCKARRWEQEYIDNPRLSPMAPILQHCRRCGFTKDAEP